MPMNINDLINFDPYEVLLQLKRNQEHLYNENIILNQKLNNQIAIINNLVYEIAVLKAIQQQDMTKPQMPEKIPI